MQPIPITESRPTSPTYAIWQLWDRLFRSGRLKTLTHAEANVLQALVHHSRVTDWVTWVSVETLTGYLPGVRSTVQRAIRALTAKGFVQVEERPGRSNLVAIDRQLLTELTKEGQRSEAPRGRIERPTRGSGGSVVRPEQSRQIQNRVEQQTEPAQTESVADAPSKIELPNDLQELAETDRTIGRRFIESLVTTHGLEPVQTALDAITERYDSRGLTPHNRGGMLRRAVAEGWVPTIKKAAEEKTARAESIEASRPPADTTWGKSPSGRIFRVIEVTTAAVQIDDPKRGPSMVPMWAVSGWAWGTGTAPS